MNNNQFPRKGQEAGTSSSGSGVEREGAVINMEKNYVTFYSPGTFMAEDTCREIKSWDVDEAVKMADSIQERYGAIPYGFRFHTMARTNEEFHPKKTKESGFYFIGCTVQTLEEVKARNDPNERTLVINMECNGWHRIATTARGWRWSQPIHDGDTVIPYIAPEPTHSDQVEPPTAAEATGNNNPPKGPQGVEEVKR